MGLGGFEAKGLVSKGAPRCDPEWISPGGPQSNVSNDIILDRVFSAKQHGFSGEATPSV